jgi:lipid-binding SYLF domain-containing protein
VKVFAGALLAAFLAVPLFAQKDVDARLKAATEDLHAMTNASDNSIPTDLLNKASCIVVIPNLKKGGFIVGGEYGAGFFSCRRPGGVGWSAPGCIKITGGKLGLLIGGAETDVVMLVMNQGGMEHLLSDKFQLGGDASAVAGPVGRSASAMTDAEMHAQILSYSRSRGIFGGLNLAGSAVTQDGDANRALYGRNIENKDVVNGHIAVPAPAEAFVHTLNRLSSRK